MKNIRMAKVMAVVALSAAGLGVGMAGASPITLQQLDGTPALSVVSADNASTYVSLDASALGVTGTGDVNQLTVTAPQMSGVTVSIDHARNEAGTLFVYLKIDRSDDAQALYAKLPITVTNTVTGQSSTIDTQLFATADLE